MEPIPRNRLVPGTVVWAHIDFRDGTGEKARPAVVVDVRGTEVVVLPGTTSVRRHALRDHVEVRDLDDAGLRRPTGISTMPVSVDRIDLTAISGSLSPHDHQRIVEAPSRTRGQAHVAV